MKEQLDIGDGSLGSLLRKGGEPARQVGRKAGPRTKPWAMPKARRSSRMLRWNRSALAASVGDERGDVILQVLADAAQRNRTGIPCARARRVADPRQHQELRRVDGAAAEDHLAAARTTVVSPIR